jgi:hypothetical protein
MYAHRVAWILAHGEFDDALKILHRCDNPPCVRPDHLFVGTQIDNCLDRDNKGRTRHGEQHAYAKLTERKVRAVRADSRSQRMIAIDYGIAQMTVSDIKRGVTWKHVR